MGVCSFQLCATETKGSKENTESSNVPQFEVELKYSSAGTKGIDKKGTSKDTKRTLFPLPMHGNQMKGSG